MSRAFVNDIINHLHENYIFYYFSIHRKNILKDIKKINWINHLSNSSINENTEFCIIDDNIYINTWFCHGNGIYFDTHCSLYTLYKIFSIVYKNLNLELRDLYHYIPKINIFELGDYKTLRFIKKNIHYRKKILVCANDVTSNQCPNFDFVPIIEPIADSFKDYLFIITVDYDGDHPNIVSTNQIYRQDFDLNEISHLSIYCDVIVGRASGAYTFTITKENINDKKKIFVCFSEFKIYSVALRIDEVQCKIFWFNNYNEQFIKKQIIQVIK